MRIAWPSTLFRFALVGTLGFLIDLGILLLATQYFGMNPLAGRALSLPVAALVTYSFNRRFTFGVAGGSAGRLLLYIACIALGLLANTAVYALILSILGVQPPVLSFAAGCGALAGLLFNYALARGVVFRPVQDASA